MTRTPAVLPRAARPHNGTRSAGASTSSGRLPGEEHPGRRDQDLGSLLAATAARRLDAPAALAAITAARSLAAELEHGELAFIDAARSDGATWSQIAAAMGTRNRQTAQKRHADLARRCMRPPSVDAPAAPEPRQQEAAHGGRPAGTAAPGSGDSSPARASRSARDRRQDQPVPSPAAAEAVGSVPPARGRREQPLPAITSAIIGDGQYELVRAPGHHETRAWHVLVGGTRVGLVRPTWRGERSRPGWEPVDNTGAALPATGIGRVTPAGNARTRDAAAVSLLRALQRHQENEHKRKHPR